MSRAEAAEIPARGADHTDGDVDEAIDVPLHPAQVGGMPRTADLVRAMTAHFAARSLAEQDQALGLLAVILDEAPAGVAARVAATLWDVETAALDPLGVIERIVRDHLIAEHARTAAGGIR